MWTDETEEAWHRIELQCECGRRFWWILIVSLITAASTLQLTGEGTEPVQKQCTQTHTALCCCTDGFDTINQMSNSGVDFTEIDWLKVSEFASVSELSETHTADSSDSTPKHRRTHEFTFKKLFTTRLSAKPSLIKTNRAERSSASKVASNEIAKIVIISKHRSQALLWYFHLVFIRSWFVFQWSWHKCYLEKTELWWKCSTSAGFLSCFNWVWCRECHRSDIRGSMRW